MTIDNNCDNEDWEFAYEMWREGGIEFGGVTIYDIDDFIIVRAENLPLVEAEAAEATAHGPVPTEYWSSATDALQILAAVPAFHAADPFPKCCGCGHMMADGPAVYVIFVPVCWNCVPKPSDPLLTS